MITPTRRSCWSMAKSITHAAVGILVGDGLLDVDAPAAVPEWRGTDKEAITLLDLLEMRPGLRFVEDYVDAGVSQRLEMLFGDGSDDHAVTRRARDHAAYAAALPLDHPPGTVWNYSSGTTNIICGILGTIVGGGEQGMSASSASACSSRRHGHGRAAVRRRRHVGRLDVRVRLGA